MFIDYMNVAPDTSVVTFNGMTSNQIRFVFKFVDKYTVRFMAFYGYVDITTAQLFSNGPGNIRLLVSYVDLWRDLGDPGYIWIENEFGLVYKGLMSPLLVPLAYPDYHFSVIIGGHPTLGLTGFYGTVNFFMLIEGFFPATGNLIPLITYLAPYHCFNGTNCQIALHSSVCFGNRLILYSI